MSQTLQSVLCITTNKYLVRVLVVLLHARFSVVGPIPFLLAAIFFQSIPMLMCEDQKMQIMETEAITFMNPLGLLCLAKNCICGQSSSTVQPSTVDLRNAKKTLTCTIPSVKKSVRK